MDTEDWSISTAVNQLRDTLLNGIPVLNESTYYIDRLFGGDHQRFVTSIKRNISPPDMGPESMMIMETTAKVIGRTIKVHTQESLPTNAPVKLESGPEAKQRLAFNVLFHQNRFWSLHPYQEDSLEEAHGMEEASQSEKGRYKKKKGPTLAVKTKQPGTKCRKDE